ncbi:MAG: acyl carrier protein [Acidobacteria bacterium]|nr:acyl carrier protein [Acidobacteriota bacterium]
MTTAQLPDALHGILSRHFRTPAPGELHDALDLGPAGFGLDSIALAELLIVCEDHFGCPFPYTLFDEGPLTVGRLIAHVRDARASTIEP